VRACTEQASPNIQVTLGSGVRSPWFKKIQPIGVGVIEINSILQLQQIFKSRKYSRRAKVSFQSWLELGEGTKPGALVGNHHMGTTRMHMI